MKVFTLELSDGHVFHVLALAPSGDYGALRTTFDRMVPSLGGTGTRTSIEWVKALAAQR